MKHTKADALRAHKLTGLYLELSAEIDQVTIARAHGRKADAQAAEARRDKIFAKIADMTNTNGGAK